MFRIFLIIFILNDILKIKSYLYNMVLPYFQGIYYYHYWKELIINAQHVSLSLSLLFCQYHYSNCHLSLSYFELVALSGNISLPIRSHSTIYSIYIYFRTEINFNLLLYYMQMTLITDHFAKQEYNQYNSTYIISITMWYLVEMIKPLDETYTCSKRSAVAVFADS